ncbi:MAG: hypothetical protein LBJ14_06615 [Desulfarculales bacterium]|jgi:hypothetical protein|nr:hypothetical protein [Desulfarculales bacterium]
MEETQAPAPPSEAAETTQAPPPPSPSQEPAAPATEGKAGLNLFAEDGKGEAPSQEGQGEDKAEDGKPPALPAGPADYKLNFQADTQVDAALLGKFQAWAHENKIPLDKAQALAGQYEAAVKEQMTAHQQAQAQAAGAQYEAWRQEILKDPLLGGANLEKTRTNLARAVSEFGSDELKQLINDSGLGFHPEFVRFVNKVGLALAEPRGIKGSASGGGEPDNEQFIRDNWERNK